MSAKMTDVDGFEWIDQRLQQPEHFVAAKDGFTIEIKRVNRDVQGTKLQWEWSVQKGVACASGFALRKDSGIDFAKESMKLLQRSLTEVEE